MRTTRSGAIPPASGRCLMTSPTRRWKQALPEIPSTMSTRPVVAPGSRRDLGHHCNRSRGGISVCTRSQSRDFADGEEGIRALAGAPPAIVEQPRDGEAHDMHLMAHGSVASASARSGWRCIKSFAALSRVEMHPESRYRDGSIAAVTKDISQQPCRCSCWNCRRTLRRRCRPATSRCAIAVRRRVMSAPCRPIARRR
jgi:hypothetical protein